MEHLIAGCFGMTLGIVGVLTGFKQLRNRTVLRSWKTTSGRVIERGTYVPNFAMLSVPAYRHAPLVKYTYEVDGAQFSSNAITPERIQQPQHNTLDWARRKADSFANEVVVHYNPENPAESYLQLTSRWMLWVVVGASCLAMLISGLFLLSWMMREK